MMAQGKNEGSGSGSNVEEILLYVVRDFQRPNVSGKLVLRGEQCHYGRAKVHRVHIRACRHVRSKRRNIARSGLQLIVRLLQPLKGNAGDVHTMAIGTFRCSL